MLTHCYLMTSTPLYFCLLNGINYSSILLPVPYASSSVSSLYAHQCYLAVGAQAGSVVAAHDSRRCHSSICRNIRTLCLIKRHYILKWQPNLKQRKSSGHPSSWTTSPPFSWKSCRPWPRSWKLTRPPNGGATSSTGPQMRRTSLSTRSRWPLWPDAEGPPQSSRFVAGRDR